MDRPKMNNIYLDTTGKKSSCAVNMVKCVGNTDCNDNCIQDMEYTCQNITNPDRTENPNKYCLPVRPDSPCKKEKGCIPVWTGWGDTNRMEWDPMCMYPDYFGGIGCEHTPGVCDIKGKSFMRDRDYSLDPPKFDDCVLPQELVNRGYTIKQRLDGTPIIIAPGQGNYYKY